ncbi:MAG: threonine synthase [Nitrospirales bacterium]|nr:threonine synthase [Nitrospirales bacterium]
MIMWRGVIEEFRKFLPIDESTPVVSLCEGNTPLIPATCLAKQLFPQINLYLKFEGANPTGSFKDRGMSLAVSKALEKGAQALMCASTGNTSASAAAYGAKAGLPVYVLVPMGKVALGKLAQAMAHGATVIQIEGNFDQALGIVKELSQDDSIELVNSLNPYRLEGQKTGAMEVSDQLGVAPDLHILPVGNAGNISAYWRGYKEYRTAGQIHALPQMIGVQAEGAAPLVHGRVVEDPQTIATAIRIGNPASWRLAVQAMEESNGRIFDVSDEEILHAHALLAQVEGVFCEPASAASLAGLVKLNQVSHLPEGTTIVCTLTGHGLKDPDTAMKASPEPLTVKASRDDVSAALRL